MNELPTPVTLHLTASDSDSGDNISRVLFQLNGLTHEDTNSLDGWTWTNLDIGSLLPTSGSNPNKLTVIAYDSYDEPSTPLISYFDIIEQPCWINKNLDNLSFSNDKYIFNWEKSYGVSKTLDKNVPLIGGYGIALSLDLDISWEHSILTHQDLNERFSGPFKFDILGKKIIDIDNSGIFNVDDNLNLSKAMLQWSYSTSSIPIFSGTYFYPIVPGILDVWLDTYLEGIYDIDLNVGYDNCLEISQASFVPSATVSGSVAVRANALLGVVYLEAGAQPNLPIWFIVPLTNSQNWGLGGEFWVDYWAEIGTEFCVKFWRLKRCFTVWNVRHDGTLPDPPYKFGDPKPNLLTPLMVIEQSQGVTTNLPDVYAAPKASVDRYGNTLVVWVHDSIEEKESSEPELYAALGDIDGFQSVIPLTQDSAFDMDPDVSFDGDGNAMVVWTRNKLPEGSKPEFHEILANNEIAYLYYNRNQDHWSTPKFITHDSLPDGIPRVSMSLNGQGLAAWTHTKDNDLTTRNDIEIHYAHWNGQQWSSPIALTDNMAADYDVQVAMDSESNGIAVWIQDADANQETVEDVDIMYSLWNGSKWTVPDYVTNTDRQVQHPHVAFDENDNPYAIWIERQINDDSTKTDYIMFASGNRGTLTWSIPEIVFSDTMLVDEPILSIRTHTETGDIIAMVSWRGYGGMDGDMFVSYKNMTDNTPWTEPAQVTNDEYVDWMSTSVIDSNNNAMILSVKTDLYNPDTDNSQLGNFMDGINIFIAPVDHFLSGVGQGLENTKARLTFFYKENITERDRLSITGLKKPKFHEMPFDKDVTVTVEVPDPQQPTNTLQIFSQTIPKNTVSGTKKYRFRSGDSGIQELLFDQRSDSTYFYVNVNEVDFLPSIRTAMTPQAYLNFIRNIGSYTITIEIDGNIWSGTAPLEIGKLTSQKQELNFRR
jgi:hypothetical protein